MNDMQRNDFFHRVSEEFAFLLVDHGFSLVSEIISDHFDSCETRLKSEKWWIRISRERDSINIFVGSNSITDIGFTFADVVSAIEDDSEFEGLDKQLYPDPDWDLAYNELLVKHLRWYGKRFREYVDRIEQFLTHDSYSSKFEELVAKKRSAVKRVYDLMDEIKSNEE